ncbi:hypothetical protein AB1Y20_012037 [Prymnesium parvum]|uniref:Uncharacterized protein n=1 Tax=Prymnesium parvum TaxID=97485 RepID=A0AB34IQ72_PRYPA
MGVSFGGVTVHLHARAIDRSKLPSDGVAPLGLGAKLHTEEYADLDQFDRSRRAASTARHGAELRLWFHVPPSLRCELLAECSAEELAAVAEENASILGIDEAPRDAAAPQPLGAARGDGVRYSNAKATDAREGVCGAFSEVQPEENERRRKRAHEELQLKEQRKAERRKCVGCHRYACIC